MPQQVVYGGMSPGVIDHLKLIEIKIQQDMRNVRVRRAQQVDQASLEFISIDQTCECVVGRLMG